MRICLCDAFHKRQGDFTHFHDGLWLFRKGMWLSTLEWIGSAPGRSGIGFMVVVVVGGGLRLFLSNPPEESGCLVVVVSLGGLSVLTTNWLLSSPSLVGTLDTEPCRASSFSWPLCELHGLPAASEGVGPTPNYTWNWVFSGNQSIKVSFPWRVGSVFSQQITIQ